VLKNNRIGRLLDARGSGGVAPTSFSGPLGSGIFRRFQRAKAGEKSIHVGNFEQRPDSIGEPENRESPVGPLAGSEHADHASETSRIHVRDTRDVDNERFGGLLTRRRLKIEKRVKRQLSVQLDDASAVCAIQKFNLEVFRSAWVHE
jgi:hypothetical protein